MTQRITQRNGKRNVTRGENENENDNDNMNATNAEWWEMCWCIRLNDWAIKRCQRRRVGSRNDNILPGYHKKETERRESISTTFWLPTRFGYWTRISKLRFPFRSQSARGSAQHWMWRLRLRFQLWLMCLLLKSTANCAQCALMARHEQNRMH